MPDRINFSLGTSDGVKLCCYEWPAENAKAAVVILHGLADHALRYGRFAAALNEAGFAAVSMDLRGHGRTAAGGVKGRFAKKNGWKLVLGDIRQLTLWAQDRYPGRPLVLFGHSVGSIFARAALPAYGELYRAVVLSAVNTDLPLRRNIAPLITGAAGLVFGMGKPSPLLDGLTFGAYNKPYQPAKTRFEWLSADRTEVDKYVADENCGFVSTASLFYDLSLALLCTLKRKNIARIPKGLPLLIVSGSRDPGGRFGKTAGELERCYRAAGLFAVAKVYEGGRHELLNDLCRQTATEDIIAFLDRTVTG